MPSPNTDQYDAEWNRLLMADASSNQTDAETERLNRQNAFAHDPNNGAVAGRDYILNFTPNILDNYDQYTYHWKFFITSLENAREGRVLKPENQVIIAESGVTDLTIDKIELEGTAIPTAQIGTGTQTRVKFEIVEPSGAGLMDKLFYQAVGLGIGNWMVTPYFLQLEFKGRSPSTSETNESGNPPGMESKKWLWPIKLSDAKVHVDHVGTRYQFESIIYDELAQSDLYFCVQQQVVLDKLTDFGSAMQILEDKLNADQYEKLIENYSIPDSYRIVVDPVLAKIDLGTPKENVNTTWSKDFIDFGKKTATYNAGTGIDKIIDSMLVNSDHYQEKMQQSDTPSSTPKSSNKETDQMKKLWRIVTETRPIAFDILRQNNANEITIYIVEYTIGVLDVVATQTGQTAETLNASKVRMGEYATRKIMNKKYNYIFTGLNDQIIKFDLEMNYAYVATLARFGGAFYDSFISTPGIVVERNVKQEEEELKKIVRDAIQFIHRTPPGPSVDKQIATVQNILATSYVSDDLIEKYNTLLINAKSADRKPFLDKIKADSLADSQRYAKFLATPTPLTDSHGNKIGQTTFLSDVDINDAGARAAHDAYMSLAAGKLRPMSFSEGQQEAAVAFGIDPAKTAGRSRVSSIFATALYTGLDASMQQIKLTIKGDPYWLFPGGIDPTAKVLRYKSTMNDVDAINEIKSINPNTVNTCTTDNFIVIRFRTPRMYGVSAPNSNPSSEYNEVETFSGVYKVILITSRFEQGKFTQELFCQLDPVINLVDFLKDLNKDSMTPDIPITEGGIVSVPSTSIKTPSRIATPLVNEDGTAYITPSQFLTNQINQGLGSSSNIPPQIEGET